MEDPDSTSQLVIPPQHVQDAIGRRLSGPRRQRLETIFLLRSTAQQVDNAATEWLAGTAGSPARFQTLMLLWAAGGRPVPHQEIIAALRVKRATVSALMFSLEQDGLVQSVRDRQDRRRLLATLTSKGERVATDALDLNATRLEEVMHDLSPEDLDVLHKLLRRLREDFGSLNSG
ncbi:MAG TPA: MarR family winged helix-turn-helix transcriptional regulator [Steroidobacteraceae bacterium]|nr:MarR family winged helix-turn-helix transcriptional regulator [Steroidobacteraceae bacterium]